MQAGFVLNQSERLNRTAQYGQYMLMTCPAAGKQSGSVAPPVELAVFQAKELMEETIIRWMHRIISNQQQFMMELVQSIHPSTGMLQIGITDKTPFQQLAKQLQVVREYISSCDCPDMQFTIHPHLNKADPALQLLLSNQQEPVFQGLFEVKEFLLLKKAHDFDTYKQLNLFALRP
jgi:hypothetical protein